MFSGFHSQCDQFAHFIVLPSAFILNYTTLEKNFPVFTKIPLINEFSRLC